MKITKWCPSCATELSLRRFSRSTGRGDGLQPYCRTCQYEIAKKKAKDNKKKWAKNDPYAGAK